METFIHICFLIVLLATQAHSSETPDTCVQVELAGGRTEDNVAEVNEDDYVHINFVLTTEKCQTRPDFIRVKVSTLSRGHPMTFCTIVFQENTCKITDQSLPCHCINKELMFTLFAKKVSIPNNVLIQWNDNRSTEGEKSAFIFAIGSGPAIRTDEKIVTLIAIGICCCILVAVVFAVIATKRRGLCTQQQQGQLSEERQTTLGIHPPDVTPTSPVNLTNTQSQTGIQTASGHQEQLQGRTRARGVARLQGHKVTRTQIDILTYSGQPKPNNNGMTATQNQSSQEPVYDRAVTFSPIVHSSQEQLTDYAITSSQSSVTKTEEQQYDRAITFS